MFLETDRWQLGPRQLSRSPLPAAAGKSHRPSVPRAAFTLLELLVSMTLVLILMIMLVQITTHTSRIWRSSVTKIQSFQEARAAFDAMTRRLSQATLNTYWDYDPPAPSVPQQYVRQSELHFICGDAKTLLASANPPVPNVVTHAIFFQAPLGYAVNTNYTNLSNALNACGYFVQFANDQATRPSFLGTPLKYRYRLMEMTQRTENFSVYTGTTGNNWFLAAAASNSRMIAENVIALVVLPKLAPSEQKNPGVADDLTTDYSYDSRTTDPKKSITRNQLPPIVQVTAVMLDENSAIRLDNGSAPPDLGVDLGTLFQTVASYPDDLNKLQTALNSRRIVYRVFSTDVNILGAKWSSN